MNTEMVSLRTDFVKRVSRLPKPKNVGAALQPVFEALSNAIHSTQSRFPDSVVNEGLVKVAISMDRKKQEVQVSVEDNGIGLDQTNWKAFTTTDTDHKIKAGGKGVGRLLWLDCFDSTIVDSIFEESGRLRKRSFNFVLSSDNQIKNLSLESASNSDHTGFHVRFHGLKSNGYKERFPAKEGSIFQHVTSHFLPIFIGDHCPRVIVKVNQETQEFPGAINDIVGRKTSEEVEGGDEYGAMTLTLMECNRVASSDLNGKHFVHFVAHDRAVHSQCIDSKLGLGFLGVDKDLVFHAILTGQYLDSNVNQERTAFNFNDKTISEVVKRICMTSIEGFLRPHLTTLENEQRKQIGEIAEHYPSVAFGPVEELRKRVPKGEVEGDAIYSHLARERYRRDRKQGDKIRKALQKLKGGQLDAKEFCDTIRKAGEAIEDAEQRSLTEYIVRRKVVLDFVEQLLTKVRMDTGDSSYQTEEVLHSFICPMRVNMSDGMSSAVHPATSHDLWIVDERLTFAQYFSSDVSLDRLSKTMKGKERPDLLIFDYVHGLRCSNGSSRVILVEFKRPGRTNYRDDENPQLQVERYIQQLQTGELTDFRGRPIKLERSTVFYCYIVADIMGKLDEWTYSWQKTVDGKGRIYRPVDGFQGSIELVGWDDLIGGARGRNSAFFDKAGISGAIFFSVDCD